MFQFCHRPAVWLFTAATSFARAAGENRPNGVGSAKSLRISRSDRPRASPEQAQRLVTLQCAAGGSFPVAFTLHEAAPGNDPPAAGYVRLNPVIKPRLFVSDEGLQGERCGISPLAVRSGRLRRRSQARPRRTLSEQGRMKSSFPVAFTLHEAAPGNDPPAARYVLYESRHRNRSVLYPMRGCKGRDSVLSPCSQPRRTCPSRRNNRQKKPR